MDWFKVIVLLVLGYLLYREFTRKKYINLEHLGNTDTSGIGITEYSDKLIITKPIVFQNDVTCNNIKMNNLSANEIGATRIKTNDILSSSATVGNDLYVGNNNDKWHIRNNRFGIMNRFDLVNNENNTPIMVLNYNSSKPTDFYSGPIMANRMWAKEDISGNIFNARDSFVGPRALILGNIDAKNINSDIINSRRVNASERVDIKDMLLQQEGDFFVIRNNKVQDKRVTIHKNAYQPLANETLAIPALRGAFGETLRPAQGGSVTPATI